MATSPFALDNEELKNSVQVLLLLHLKPNKISDLIAEAYKNTAKNWQEEIFYLVKNKFEEKETQEIFFAKKLEADISESIYESPVWQKIDALSFEEKLPYLLHHILGWDNEKVGKLLQLSISEVEVLFVRILKKLEN